MIKVLYLEDERWQSEGSVSLALQIEFGYAITNCFTIEDAHKRLQGEVWDVVILDVGLNASKALRYEESSFVILERIREGQYRSARNPPHLPVVFASGVWDMIIVMQDGSRVPVANLRTIKKVSDEHCVRKPINVDTLHTAIKAALEPRDT